MPNKIENHYPIPVHYHHQNALFSIRQKDEVAKHPEPHLPTAKKPVSFFSKLLKSINLFEKVRNFITFKPSRKIYNDPKDFNVQYEEVSVKTSDGETLHGYFLQAVGAGFPPKDGSASSGKPAQKDNVVIYLHGNDYNVSRWFLAPVNLQKEVNVNFLIVDYRGYGKSTGEPSVKGVITDAHAMYNYLIQKGYKPENISLYGRSLGGGVAFELGTKVKVKSVVGQSTFSSRKDVVKYHYWFIPSFLINNDLLNSKELVKKINCPVLISHGTEDEIIPLDQAHELYNQANEPKKLIVLEGAGHEHLKDYYTEEYFKTLREMFL